jgi:hypothetical protein
MSVTKSSLACLRDKLYAVVRLVEALRYRRKVVGSNSDGVI